MPAPTPIAAADVPDSVSFTVPAGVKPGIAAAYNQAILAQYNALPSDQQGAFVPQPLLNWIRARFGDVAQSWQNQTIRAEVMGERIEEKWPALTQAQRNQVKAILATVP